MTKQLSDFTGAPYIFHLKDNETKIHIGEFTLFAELWAKKEFGSMDEFYIKVIGDAENGKDPDLEAILKTIYFLMWDSDKEQFETIEDLAKQLTYKNFKEAATAIFQAIRDSIPEDILKKNMTIATKTKNVTRNRMTK